MKYWLLTLFIMLPFYSGAQEYMAGKLAENRVDEQTNDTIKRSYWQVMERAGLGRKLHTYYRISRINDSIYLDLKVIEGGTTFVVPRGAELRLMLDNGDILVLHNLKYQVSCAGCGARGYAGGGDAQGVSLTFPLDKEDIRLLHRYYVVAIGINTGEDYLEKKVTESHSSLFMSELRHVYSMNH